MPDIIEKYYRLQAPLYDLTRPLFLFERNRAREALDAQKGETLLEIGCGTGYNIVSLAKSVGNVGKVYGLDSSSSMLSIARAKAARHMLSNIHLIEGDARSFKAPEKVDRILFSYSLSMMGNSDNVIEKALENLKPSGTLVIVDFFCPDTGKASLLFQLWRKWLSFNHVTLSPAPLAYIRGKASSMDVTVFRKGYNYILKAIF
ncbi:MAG: class I SAM-dependent methyltransferase [Vulcanimicrobiota bacterium]